MVRTLIDSWMEHHRGQTGLRGWIVLKADVRWMHKVVRVAKQVATSE